MTITSDMHTTSEFPCSCSRSSLCEGQTQCSRNWKEDHEQTNRCDCKSQNLCHLFFLSAAVPGRPVLLSSLSWKCLYRSVGSSIYSHREYHLEKRCIQLTSLRVSVTRGRP